MQLRPATLADLDLLRRWDGQPHVRDAVGADAWYDWPVELAVEPPWRELLIAEQDGRPIGAVEIIDPAAEATHYWGRVGQDLRAVDIWLGEPGDLGRGHGTAIMRLVLQRCFADPAVSAVLVEPLVSNVRAQRFYERLGFRRIERRRFEIEECWVYRLERAEWAERRAAGGARP